MSSSTLFFIAEEDKSSAGESGCDNPLISSCDNNSNFQSYSSIPRRSKTLPLEALGYKRYNTMPSRSGVRSYSVGDRNRKIKEDHLKRRSKKEREIKGGGDDMKNQVVSERTGDSSVRSDSKEVLSESTYSIPVICLTETDSGNVEDIIKESELSETLGQLQDSEICDSYETEDMEGLSFTASSDLDLAKQEDSETKKVIDHFVKKSPNLKEVRSSSSDSSRTSNKSRTDSFNTDSTTSGISSCESGPHLCLSSEVVSLSPIPSTNSVETVGMTMSTTESKELVHPSSFRRRSLNLNRIPSVRMKQSSPGYGILPSAKLLEGASRENTVVYTSTRDAMGYETWRSIKRNRRISSEVESDMGLGMLYGEEEPQEQLTRRPSIDSKFSTDTFTFRLRFVLSCQWYIFLHPQTEFSMYMCSQ